jgi:hypothetical protein
MPGRDLPDLEERPRQLPAALAVRAPAGLAERVAHRGRVRRRLRRAGAATVVAALLAGAVLTRAVVLDRAPAPVLSPGLLAQNATPARLAGGRWQALPALPAGLLAPAARRRWSGRAAAGRLGRGQRSPVPGLRRRGRLRPGDPPLDAAPPRPRGPVARGRPWAGRLDRPGAAGRRRRGGRRGRGVAAAAYDPAAGRWLRLPTEPSGRAMPPVPSGDVARALLRVRYLTTGAVQVWVLIPAAQP